MRSEESLVNNCGSVEIKLNWYVEKAAEKLIDGNPSSLLLVASSSASASSSHTRSVGIGGGGDCDDRSGGGGDHIVNGSVVIVITWSQSPLNGLSITTTDHSGNDQDVPD